MKTRPRPNAHNSWVIQMEPDVHRNVSEMEDFVMYLANVTFVLVNFFQSNF